MTDTLLVLNCYSRNSLALINTLGRRYDLIGGDCKKGKYFLLNPDRRFKSAKVREIFRYTDPNRDAQAFRDDLVAACRRYEATGVIGSGTTITNELSKHKEEIERLSGAKVAVDSYSRLEQLTDKWMTVQLCRELEIPTPRTVLLESAEPGLIEKVSALGFPLLVKPRMSYAARGVRFFQSQHELDGFCRTADGQEAFGASGAQYIAQEAISGDLHDVTLCAHDGEPVCMLTQRRVVTLYDFGGGGIVNLTTREPKLMEYARRLTQSTRWNGVAMLDFICSQQGDFYLLECNPKHWGTTQLTIDAGLDVAQCAVDLFVHGKTPQTQNGYEEGLLYRWIFPEVVYHLIHHPFSPGRLRGRLGNVLSRHGASRVVHNIRRADMAHLLGIVFNRTTL